MKPKNIQYASVNTILDYIPNVDRGDLSENYALDIRGFRTNRAGMIGERDYGTKHRYASYPTGITIVKQGGSKLFVTADQQDYDILVGYDSANNMRIFVGNGTTWTELTEVFSATVDSISGVTAVISTIKDILGNAYGTAQSADYWKNFIGFSASQNKGGLITASTAYSGSGTMTLTFVNKPDVALNMVPGIAGDLKLYRSTGILPSTVLGEGRGYRFDNGTTPHIRFTDNEAQAKTTMLYGDSSSPVVCRQPLQIRKGGFLGTGSFTIGGASTGWSAIPTGNGSNVNGMAVLSGGKLFACFDDARIYQSTDAGATWSIVNTYTYALMKIRAYTTDTLYAVGRNYGVGVTQVLKSTNGTNATPTFSNVASGASSADLLNLWVVDGSNVIACGYGGKIIKTVDAGSNWVDKNLAVTDTINGIYFLDANTGWVCTSTISGKGGKIYKTTNGGTSWTEQKSTSYYLYAIQFFNASDGVCTGSDGQVYWTNDGGTTWNNVNVGTGITSYLYDLSMVNTTDARAVGEDGRMFVTTNAGHSWSEESIPAIGHLYSIVLTSTTVGYAGGNAGGAIKLSGASGVKGGGPESGWTIQKAGLIPNYVSFGSLGSEIVAGGTPEPQTITDEGIQLTLTVQSEVDTGQKNSRMYITALYSESTGTEIYQESDPIAKIFLASASALTYVSVQVKVALDLANLNKNFIGLRFYHAWKDENDVPVDEWIDASDEYLLAYELLTTSNGWTVDTSNRYAYYNQVNQFTLSLIAASKASAPSNILANLNHEPDLNRDYMTPMFAVKGLNQYGPVVVMAQDNRVLRISSYDGDGVHEDDNFPAMSVDNQSVKQEIFLRGHGDIGGLGFMGTTVYVFRLSNEMEVYNLVTGDTLILPVDFYAKDSLVGLGGDDAPRGLFFTGRSGAYLIPSDGGEIFLANPNWKNVFDGSQMLSDGSTPIVTDSYRSAVLAGYDPVYQTIWMHIQQNKEGGGTEFLCYRFYADKRKWDIREVNTSGSALKFFGSRKDGTFTIGTPSAILKYPNTDTTATSHPYEDMVTSAGVSASLGIPTKIRINIGSIYNLVNVKAIYSFIVDKFGTSAENQRFTVNLYANGQAVAFDTKYLMMDIKNPERLVEEFGTVERLELEIIFPTTNLHKFKRFDLSKIMVGMTPQNRIGNN